MTLLCPSRGVEPSDWCFGNALGVRRAPCDLAFFSMTDIPLEKRCLVCKTAEWNCSLDCYKRHKSFCVKPSEEPHAQEFRSFLLTWATIVMTTFPLEFLKGTSRRLQELLSNRHLRDYLLDLDSSPRPAVAIEKAMREPLFIEFADECLRLVNPDNQIPSRQDSY
ncbi:hypothetical protein Aperf_G00000060892 [Anoplocephala perfoliata]